jgi:hypothetical protein
MLRRLEQFRFRTGSVCHILFPSRAAEMPARRLQAPEIFLPPQATKARAMNQRQKNAEPKLRAKQQGGSYLLAGAAFAAAT